MVLQSSSHVWPADATASPQQVPTIARMALSIGRRVGQCPKRDDFLGFTAKDPLTKVAVAPRQLPLLDRTIAMQGLHQEDVVSGAEELLLHDRWPGLRDYRSARDNADNSTHVIAHTVAHTAAHAAAHAVAQPI